MELSGFFDALEIDGEFDREYNGKHYSDMFAAIVGSGVRRSGINDLYVSAAGSNMVINAGIGWAFINGYWYHNDTAKPFTVPTAPVGDLSRIDRIVLRLDENVATRNVFLVYKTGTPSSTPTAPVLIRGGGIYELAIADITVSPSVTVITQSNLTDQRANATVCGWITTPVGYDDYFESLDQAFNDWFLSVRDTLASVTAEITYKQLTTISSPTNQVAITLSQYDTSLYQKLEVYVNGDRLETPNHYSVSGNIVTFITQLTAGTLVGIYITVPKDATGLDSIIDDVTVLQQTVNDMGAVNKFTYNCTGLNDNISLSQIAQALHNGSYSTTGLTEAADAFLTRLGNSYISNLSDDAQITIDVVGEIGATTPNSGEGTELSRYKWFELGQSDYTSKRIIFDFSHCEMININCSNNSDNIIFFGTNQIVKNCKAYAYNTGIGCKIQMFSGRYNTGEIIATDCDFHVKTSGTALISINGRFINTNCFVKSLAGTAVCFAPQTNCLVRIFGGTHYAYGVTGQIIAVIYTANSSPDAAVLADNLNCPRVDVAGYSQGYFIRANGGQIYVNGLVSIISSTGGTYYTISGLISLNKVENTPTVAD